MSASKAKKKRAKAARKPAKRAQRKKRIVSPVFYRDERGRFISRKNYLRAKKRGRAVKETPRFRSYDAESLHTPQASAAPERIKLTPAKRPNILQTPDADTVPAFGAPQFEVTSLTERNLVVHAELRNKAIKEGLMVIPDERIRDIQSNFKEGLKQNLIVKEFLTESNLEEILYHTREHLHNLKNRAKADREANYYLTIYQTEYGIELYGSDKGEIARVDGLKSEALHWSVWGSPGGTPERALEAVKAYLHGVLEKGGRTTILVESVMATIVYKGKPR